MTIATPTLPVSLIYLMSKILGNLGEAACLVYCSEVELVCYSSAEGCVLAPPHCSSIAQLSPPVFVAEPARVASATVDTVIGSKSWPFIARLVNSLLLRLLRRVADLD